jgi:hypothetical protein
MFFALINLGVFYRYAPFFKKDHSVIIHAVIVAFGLAAIYMYCWNILLPEKYSRESIGRRGYAGQSE